LLAIAVSILLKMKNLKRQRNYFTELLRAQALIPVPRRPLQICWP